MLPRGHRSRVQTYSGEAEGVNFDAESRDVLLLEFSSQMALDEGGLDQTGSACTPDAPPLCSVTHLSSTAVAHKHQLEGWGLCLCHVSDLECDCSGGLVDAKSLSLSMGDAKLEIRGQAVRGSVVEGLVVSMNSAKGWWRG
jgi:hypothetical protein